MRKQEAEKILESWLNPVLGFALKRCKTPEDAEDLSQEIICEATAVLKPEYVQNGEGLADEHTAYLCAFRTNEAYRGQGYFSALMQFMLEDLRRKGYTKVTVGVEPEEETNRQIYDHWGFSEFIKSSRESYPDGTEIEVEYYGKRL